MISEESDTPCLIPTKEIICTMLKYIFVALNSDENIGWRNGSHPQKSGMTNKKYGCVYVNTSLLLLIHKLLVANY